MVDSTQDRLAPWWHWDWACVQYLQLLTDRRNPLKEDAIEAFECNEVLEYRWPWRINFIKGCWWDVARAGKYQALSMRACTYSRCYIYQYLSYSETYLPAWRPPGDFWCSHSHPKSVTLYFTKRCYRRVQPSRAQITKIYRKSRSSLNFRRMGDTVLWLIGQSKDVSNLPIEVVIYLIKNIRTSYHCASSRWFR